MKKLELRLIVVSVLRKIKFAPTQISVIKIDMLMSKTVCINPWYYITQNCFSGKHDVNKEIQCSVFLLLRLLFFKWNNPWI